jgi:hypothetical protein
MLPIILHYFPAGSSMKAWRHYGQLISSGKECTLQVIFMLCEPPSLIYQLYMNFQGIESKHLERGRSTVYLHCTAPEENGPSTGLHGWATIHHSILRHIDVFLRSLAVNYDQIVLLQWFSYHSSVTTIRHYEIIRKLYDVLDSTFLSSKEKLRKSMLLYPEKNGW